MGNRSDHALRQSIFVKAAASQVARAGGSIPGRPIFSAVAEKLAALMTGSDFKERAARGDLDQASALADRAAGQAHGRAGRRAARIGRCTPIFRGDQRTQGGQPVECRKQVEKTSNIFTQPAASWSIFP